MSYTPGPWQIGKTDASHRVAFVTDKDGHNLAVAFFGNADLIAAAPELLEAMFPLLSYAVEHALERGERPECIDKAIAAAFKALPELKQGVDSLIAATPPGTLLLSH